MIWCNGILYFGAPEHNSLLSNSVFRIPTTVEISTFLIRFGFKYQLSTHTVSVASRGSNITSLFTSISYSLALAIELAYACLYSGVFSAELV